MNGVELVSGWFTPTVLFCVLNLMIGTIFITSTLKPQKKHREPGDSEDAPPHPHPPPIVRVPSFLERVKSFNLSRYRSEPEGPVQSEAPAEEQTEAATEPVHQHVTEEPHHVTRRTSESGPAAANKARVLKKSESEKGAVVADEEWEMEEQRRPAPMREAVGGDEAVDEKADDFINRFKQQLKLQRLDSILRYREMLNRGAGR